MTPEKRVQSAIMTFLREYPEEKAFIDVYRRQAGGYSYTMGIPDLYAVVNGWHVEIEVKRPGGQLRPMQMKFRDKCLKHHTHYLCAESVEDVKMFLFLHFGIK